MSVNEESSYKILANNIYKFRVLNNLSQKELPEKHGSKLTKKKNNYYNAGDNIQKFLSSVPAGHQRTKPN